MVWGSHTQTSNRSLTATFAVDPGPTSVVAPGPTSVVDPGPTSVLAPGATSAQLHTTVLEKRGNPKDVPHAQRTAKTFRDLAEEFRKASAELRASAHPRPYNYPPPGHPGLSTQRSQFNRR
uniref:Uncharacterized protein n=1 Tax=Lutzomyia longipalpis TaxID=7200 RepID=A0A1B0CT27_LUTLO